MACNFFACRGSVLVRESWKLLLSQYTYGNDHSQIRWELHPHQPVAGALSQPVLALVYRLCRIQSCSILLHQFLPTGNDPEESGRRRSLLRGRES